MKTISLWQPYATLIAAGYKRIETRSWAPRGLRSGQLVAIHAAKRWTADERALANSDPFFKRYLMLAERRGLWRIEQPPLGCVVAIARFHRAVPTDELRQRIPERERCFGNYQTGRWGWLFTEVRPIEPLTLRGQQGVFDWMPPEGLPYLEPINMAKQVVAKQVVIPSGVVTATPVPMDEQPQPTRVVHCRKEAYDVYIGRPMPRYPELRSIGFGNPFRPAPGVDAIVQYREWILQQPQLLARLPELRGKRLGCWCAPLGGLPGNLYGHVCHGEVLAALADGWCAQCDRMESAQHVHEHERAAAVAVCGASITSIISG